MDSGRDSGRGGYARPGERSADRGSRQGWTGGDRSSGPGGGDRGRRDDRGWRGSDRSWRGSDGGWRGSDGGWRGSNRGWRGSYNEPPRSGWRAHGYRPRYPAYYRYGYVHRHGFYFPRYYFDYEYYPAHGSIRIQAEPADAEVYVDGYYAGIVDDFDGLFQRLDVAPGPHEITLRLDGFRTWSTEVYAVPGETVRLHLRMLPGPSGDEPGVYDDRGDAGPYDQPEPDER